MNPKAYKTVTANLNPDGSPSIIAWRGKTFDTIPLSDGKGGIIPKVSPVDPADLADLVAASRKLLERAAGLDQSATRDGLANCDAIARVRAALDKLAPV
jgi:hypothetical protein